MSSTVFAYPLDPTGRNPANRVEGELHTLTPKNVRAVIPRYGPYYTESLRVYDEATGLPLQRNTQYRCVELLQDASMQYGQEICALILIVDRSVSADIRIEYQVLGGYFTNNVTVLSTLYEAVVNDTRPVDWVNVEDKPLMYPPTMHRHVLSDVYGWEPIVAVLERIRSAIVLSNVPAFEALLDYIDQQLQVYYTRVDAAVSVSAGHASRSDNPHHVTKAHVELGHVSNLPIVTLDEVKAGIPVNKYLTHEMFIAAVAAMGGISGGGGGGSGSGGGSGGGGTVDSPTYILTHDIDKVREGYAVTFTITTTLVPDNTVLYWTVVYMGSDVLDFRAIGGMVGIRANTATFQVEVLTDGLIEVNEAFAVQLHVDSGLGRVVATSRMIVIEDVAPIIIPVKPPAEIIAATSLYEPGIKLSAENYYWLQDVRTRKQYEGAPLPPPPPPPPSLVYPKPGSLAMSSPYYTGEVTARSLFIVQPLLTTTVGTGNRYTDKLPKRLMRSGSEVPVVPPKPPVIIKPGYLEACCLYNPTISINAASYYIAGRVGMILSR